jgi:hypothetical protein
MMEVQMKQKQDSKEGVETNFRKKSSSSWFKSILQWRYPASPVPNEIRL